MASFAQTLSVALAFSVSAVVANPYPVPEPILWTKRQGYGTCMNQSCEIATIAGSTGRTVYPYMTYPTGDTQDGDCCIVRYFPAVKQDVYEYRPGLQQYCAAHGGDAPLDSNPPGVDSVSLEYAPPPPSSTTSSGGLFGLGNLFPRQTEPTSEPTATCKPKILIFVKGTLETGEYGNTLGPQLQSGLDSSVWDVVGVEYDNSIDNDYCLGLPGGKVARGVLEDVIAQCPGAIYAMSGYSQGAMVVRNALARAAASDVAQVRTVVNFGDPFDGAPIGQYNGPLHVFCNQGDGVCDGQLDISLAHLSYFGDVSEAISLLNADTS